MIESRQQLLDNFSAAARAFVSDPNPANGIDFDDAVVTLKRFVLSTLRDQQLGSLLGQMPSLIRATDIGSLERMVADVEARLRE